MKMAIMQPYLFPYIGYFQLINAVDQFVVYDNIKYTKKGWISRNRFLGNGKSAYFSIALKKDSDFLQVRERVISDAFNKTKIWNQMNQAYRRAPFFSDAIALFERVLYNNERNLFDYIYFSIQEICKYLKISTECVISSSVKIDHSLKSQEKVLAICKSVGADVYINPIGGAELYSRDVFAKENIELRYIKPNTIEYMQLDNAFVPWLSILDVMMFNSVERIRMMLTDYMLV